MSNTKTTPQIQYERKWECRDCHTVTWRSYDALAEAFEPLCQKCGNAMSPSNEPHTCRLIIGGMKLGIFRLPEMNIVYEEKWECPECGADEYVEYGWVGRNGSPVCSICDRDMKMTGTAEIAIYLQ